MFETCRRLQESNLNITLKRVHFVGLHNTIGTGYLPGHAVRDVNEEGSMKRSTI